MPVDLIPGHELIRVTQVPFKRSFNTIIRGVPVSQGGQPTGVDYYVSVIAKTDFLPVEPTPGQLWSVKGFKSAKVLNHGSSTSNEHSYLYPSYSNFSCRIVLKALNILSPKIVPLRELVSRRLANSGTDLGRIFTRYLCVVGLSALTS